MPDWLSALSGTVEGTGGISMSNGANEPAHENAKTPEWAEGICGVPAETIRDLARLYAKSKPAYVRMVWAAARQIYGKQTARGLNYLQALGGNIGKDGCAGTGVGFGNAGHLVAPYIASYLGDKPGKYGWTVNLEAEMWHRAINLHKKLDAGEITMDDYKAQIGCPRHLPAPDIHLMFSITSNRNHLSGWYGASERREALLNVDHFVYAHWNMKSPQIPYADIVLPVASTFIEGVNTLGSAVTGGFTIGINPGCQNAFIYGRGGGTPPGEARSWAWIMRQLAERMGIGDEVMPRLAGVEPKDVPKVMDEAAADAWRDWKNTPAPMGGFGLTPEPPDWEEFIKKPVYRTPIEKYTVFARNNIENDVPFKTVSGKIEFYSKWIAENDMTVAQHPHGWKALGGSGFIPPMARYKHSPEGMHSVKTREYPLYMVTPHSFYRHHCAYDHSLWFNDEFRNSVWISVSDAKQRGIKDGDLVHVYSEVGECQVTAYVTSRLTPGVCCIIFGRWYTPSGMKTEKMPGGIDTRGNCNMLIPSEFYDDVLGALLCNALVEIESAEPVLRLDKLMEVS
jgi:anaerobic dimethyl sulfoxide reductase subunit A